MIIKLNKAVQVLKDGGVIAFPTETVYGLGADATNKEAVEKVFEIKKRPKDNPLICHFYSLEQVKKFVPDLNKTAELLIKSFSPGPLSLLVNLPKNTNLLPATRGKFSVIVRIPEHLLTLELIKKLDKPIVGPSANTSGKMSGTNPEMIQKDLSGKLGGILDGGNSEIGLESTILDCRNENQIKILRPGAIGVLELKKVLERVEILETGENEQKEIVPGAKYKHYSPEIDIQKIDLDKAKELKNFEENIHVILLGSSEDLKNLGELGKNVKIIDLGSKKDLNSISKNLYYNLFKTDKLNQELKLELKKAYLIDLKLGSSSIEKAIKNRLEKVVN